jgi:hypothetical protein
MKKLLFILGITGIAVGGYLVYREITPKTEIRSELSDRSKRFIAEQKGDNGVWQDANTAGERIEAREGSALEAEGCFSFVMPYAVKFVRDDGPCEVSYGLLRPRGTLIVYKREGNMSDFEDVPGVSMRRLHKEKYKEEIVSAGGRKFLVFTQTQEEQILNAFYFERDFYFVANVLGSTSDETKQKLIQLLETVKFL